MKGLLISMCALMLLPSCEKYTLTRVYRTQVMHNTVTVRDTVPRKGDTPGYDTLVYVSAVIVPSDYDWRRDSLYGAVPCELQLLCNGIPRISFQTGADASPSPDTHHLLDGHLYTEHATSDETVICMDGKELFRYPQKEVLKGLLVKGKDVYTLGRNLEGGGFCYRRNGETLLRQDEGEVFGDFSNPAYGRNGALYDNGGEVCFCFKTSSACFKVCNGAMAQVRSTVSAFRIMDMHQFGQDVYYVADYSTAVLIFAPGHTYTLPLSAGWQTVGLFLREGTPWFIADSPSQTICCPVNQAEYPNAGISFSGNDNIVYGAETHFYSARCGSGTLSINDDSGRILFIRDSTYFFGRNSIDCAGDDLFAIINPREKEQSPFVWHNGLETEYRINGYLTGVEVTVSPPSL